MKYTDNEARQVGAATPKDLKTLQTENKVLKEYLRSMTRGVESYIAWLDSEMKLPSDHARGKRITAATNKLQMLNDSAKYFGLGQRLKQKRK